MKKILLLFFVCIVMCSSVSAAETDLYIVKNITPDDLIQSVNKNLKGDNIVLDKENNVIYINSDKFYYIKAYKHDANSELFVYSTEDDISDILDTLYFKVYEYNDKSSIAQYTKEFNNYVRNNKISYVKLKSKKEKGKYNPYSKPLKNKIVAKHKIQQNGIVILRNEVVPKVRVKDKARAYEYLVTNNTGKAIVINKVASPDFIGLTQIAAYCMIPNGKSFIPVYGIIYGVQTDIEKNRFTRPHPVDEIIKAGDTMRILALSKKDDDANADFYFTVNNKQIIINLDPRKAEKL